MTKDNLWIDYFIKVREQHLKNKENWIDFESEISRIVQDLDEFQRLQAVLPGQKSTIITKRN